MMASRRRWLWTPASYSDDRREIRKSLFAKLPLRACLVSNRLLGHFHWAFLERCYYYGLLCALHYSYHLILLWLGYFKSIQRLLQVIHERHPLFIGDHEMPMSIAHRTARISLRSASRLAKLLRHVVLESLG